MRAGLPAVRGTRGFHAALAKLMPAKPPPPPASNDIPATWAPFAHLATRRPAESPQIEPRFGTEHWTAPVPPGLLEAWSHVRRLARARAAGAERLVVDAPLLKPGSTKARPAPTADEAADADRAAQALQSFRGRVAAPRRRPGKKKAQGQAQQRRRRAIKTRRGLPGRARRHGRGARVDWRRLGPPAARPLRASHALRAGAVHGAAAPTVVDAATLQLVSALVADAVAEELYPATVAGLDYTISAVLDADALALSLKCGGFDEKVPALFDALLRGVRRAADEVVEPRAFAAAKSEVALSLENAWHDADRHARRLRLCCLAPGRRFAPAQRRAALQSVDAGACQRWLRAFLDGCSRSALVGGNGAADAARSVDASLRTVSTVATARTCGPVARLPRCHAYHVDAAGEDAEGRACALECYWQLGPDSPAARLLADLLEAVIDEPLYDQLRTKEQLGYSVSCGSRWTDGIVGFGICVTSKEAHPDYVAGRVDAFLREFRREVRAVLCRRPRRARRGAGAAARREAPESARARRPRLGGYRTTGGRTCSILISSRRRLWAGRAGGRACDL